jgi:hypothetical protein
MLSDIFPTGYHGCVSAGVTTGSTVYIAGAGAVGLAAAHAAQLLGAAVVIVGDMNSSWNRNAASGWRALSRACMHMRSAHHRRASCAAAQRDHRGRRVAPGTGATTPRSTADLRRCAAMISVLLRDGTGPAYRPGAGPELRRRLGAAAAALDGASPQRLSADPPPWPD